MKTFQEFFTEIVEGIAEEKGLIILSLAEFPNAGAWIIKNNEKTVRKVFYNFQRDYATIGNARTNEEAYVNFDYGNDVEEKAAIEFIFADIKSIAAPKPARSLYRDAILEEKLFMCIRAKTPMEAYKQYQLQWMMTQGLTLDDLMKELQQLQVDIGHETTVEELFDLWCYDQGFAGSLWPCYNEWASTGGEGKEIVDALNEEMANDLADENAPVA